MFLTIVCLLREIGDWSGLVDGKLEGFFERGFGAFLGEVGDHLGLEPGVRGGGGELVVVGVEVFFDVLSLRKGSGLEFLDVLEVLEDVVEELVVGLAPVGEGDAVGAVFEVVGHAVFVLVEADLGPVAELVDEDPVVNAGFELATLVFAGGVGAGDAVEGGLLLGG